MQLQILGSESLGNCYLLRSHSETLIVEAGVRLQEIKRAMGYDLSTVAGCIVTHEHGDHFKYAGDVAKAGIDVYLSKPLIEHKDITWHRAKGYYGGGAFKVGGFTVLPFPVPHGVPCFGFLISHPDSGKILFVTDAAYISQQFRGLNHILVEANYEDAIMVNDRAVGHHMSLDTTMEFLRANDMSGVVNVVLLHLSAANSNAKMFTTSVASIAPAARVWIADKGLEIELSKYPF